MTRQEAHALFKQRYTAKDGTQRVHQAVRAEIPGGQQLLDLLKLVNIARTRGRIDKPLDFAELIEDRLQDIKEAMTAEVKARYHLDPPA